MQVTGSIRASSSGVDIAFKNETGFHKLKQGPLHSQIADLYNFIISNNNSIHINDRFFRADIRTSKKGTRKSVTLPTAMGYLTVFRFTPTDGTIPTDRAGIEIGFDTEEV